MIVARRACYKGCAGSESMLLHTNCSGHLRWSAEAGPDIRSSLCSGCLVCFLLALQSQGLIRDCGVVRVLLQAL